MAEFTMPSLGADMDAGTLLEWRVKPGDTVHSGDVVALVDTDKAAVDVECFCDGVVRELLVQPGQRVPVGTVLAVVGQDEPALAVPPAVVVPDPAPAVPVVPASAAAPRRRRGSRRAAAVTDGGEHRPSSPLVRQLAARLGVEVAGITGTGADGAVTRRDVERAAAGPAERRRVSPLAGRLAAELGVDLDAVTGTGQDGAVRADDVRRAAGPPLSAGHRRPQGPKEEPTRPERRLRSVDDAAERGLTMRRAIAALMSRSNREIPHYHVTSTIDLAAATAWLHDHNRDVPVSRRLVPATLLLKAAARAAREVPDVNGTWTDDRFVAADGVHLGLIVSLRTGGIVAPVIRDAAELALPDLMDHVRDLVERARRGRLRGSELTGATITATNLGEHGAESVLGVIYPPQVALVGFGAVVRRPWAVGDLIGVRPLVTASLSADHRASDGATGSRYLRAVGRALQRPEEL